MTDYTRYPKAKKIICPSVARCTCSEMDYSKTVSALRRSRFLELFVEFVQQNKKVLENFIYFVYYKNSS